MNNASQIQTGVDRLLTLVNERHEVTLGQASDTLRVAREIVEHWADTLVDTELITAKLSLGDTILFSQTHHENLNGKSSFISRFRWLKTRKGSYDVSLAEQLDKRERELNKRCAKLEAQYRRVTQYEELKFALSEEARKLTEQRQHLESRTLELNKGEQALAKKQKAAEEALQRVKTHETQAEEQVRVLSMRLRSLAERERDVAAKAEELDHIASRLAKLASKSHGYFSMLRESDVQLTN